MGEIAGSSQLEERFILLKVITKELGSLVWKEDICSTMEVKVYSTSQSRVWSSIESREGSLEHLPILGSKEGCFLPGSLQGTLKRELETRGLTVLSTHGYGLTNYNNTITQLTHNPFT